MAIIPWPDCLFITSVEWTPPDPPTQVNESEWTGHESVTILPAPARWAAKVTFEGAETEDGSLAYQAFRTALKGRANVFRLPAVVSPQFATDPGLKVDGANQTGLTFNIRNGTPGTVLKAGMKLLTNDQLNMVMGTVTVGSDGKATVTLANPWRTIPSDGFPIESRNPYVAVALAEPDAGWTQTYPGSFDFTTLNVRERFML